MCSTVHRYASLLSSGALPGSTMAPATLVRMRADLAAGMRAVTGARMGCAELMEESAADNRLRQVGQWRQRYKGEWVDEWLGQWHTVM